MTGNMFQIDELSYLTTIYIEYYIVGVFLHPTDSDQGSHSTYQLGNDTSCTNQLWIQQLPFRGVVHSAKNQDPHSGHFLGAKRGRLSWRRLLECRSSNCLLFEPLKQYPQ